MSQYKFITDVTEPMFGSFTKEYPDQFTTKRKNNTVHLFKIVGISSDGFISLGYNYCIGLNPTNTTDQKLSFSTNQLQFGVHYAFN